MSIEITFVRHGETDANAAGVWQGQGDHVLSPHGERQARALAERLSDRGFDVVVASDLPRTMQTAALAGFDPIADPAWREIDIGRWQGLTRAEVEQRYPEESRALRQGLQVQMGGGESWDQFSRRVSVALSDLVARTAPGSRVLIVTHGGIIHSVVGSGLQVAGRGRSWPLERVRNASVTEVVAAPDRFHLQWYNDARHAFPEAFDAGTISLIRHAESAANVDGRWHGRTDGPLSDHGRSQTERFAASNGIATRVFASPLQRARDTAEAYARHHSLRACLEPDLMEIDFAAWEGLTTSEIQERFPDEWDAVIEKGLDLPRGGGRGETFGGAGERMERLVTALAAANPDHHLGFFSHGGSIWALVARVVGLPWPRHRSLGLPTNTSLTRIQLTPEGMRLVDYNLPLR